LRTLKKIPLQIAKALGYGDDPTELIGDDCLEMLSIVDIKGSARYFNCTELIFDDKFTPRLDVSDLRRVLDEFEVDKKIMKLCDFRLVDICLRHKFK
jgi:hypothetical protein